MTPANDERVAEEIRAFLRDEIVAPDVWPRIDDRTLLLSDGLIDSLDVEQLMAFIEDTYGLELDEGDLSPVNFESLGAIVALVLGRLNGERT